MKRVLLLAALLLTATPVSAQTFNATVTGTLQVIITPAFALSFNPAAPTVLCEAPAGTVVDTLSTTGGNGNPVTYSIPATFGDFAVQGATIVVGPTGIANADCGKTWSVPVTATQPLTPAHASVTIRAPATIRRR